MSISGSSARASSSHASGSHAPSARLSITHQAEEYFAASLDGVELFRYIYRPTDAQLESPRPYLHPIRTRSGREIALYRPHDHVWHKGIAWSLPNVGVHNFWGGTTYRRDHGYEQLDNNGSMDHEEVQDASVDADTARFAHRLSWRTADRNALIGEERRLRAHVGAEQDAWGLAFETTLENLTAEAIPIGSPTTEGRDNAGYGGLFWRGPRSFTGGTVLGPDGEGDDELRGSRFPWLGFTGVHDGDGASSTLIMVDAADNIQHPPQWFVRSDMYACMNPAPFFSDVLELLPGARVTFRYAVVVADGAADTDRAHALADWGKELLA